VIWTLRSTKYCTLVKKSSFALFPSIEDYHTVVYIFPSINWDMGYFSISSGTHNGVTLKID